MSDPPPATSRRQAAGAKPKKAASPPKKPPPSKMPPEKRLSRTRKSCPQNLHARIQRSVQQRMYLVQRPELPAGWEDKPDQPVCEFVVLGSTGNAYKVQLDRVPRCTCPDFVRKEDLCKHVFFVLLKCVGIDPQSHLLYQKAFLTSEIRDLLRQMQGRRTGGAGGGDAVEATPAVQAAYAQATGAVAAPAEKIVAEQPQDDSGVTRQSLETDADCPICFDPMAGGDLVFCRTTCGANFHADCIRRWMRESSHGDCPNCRQPWQDPASGSRSNNKKKRPRDDEGYLNLANVTGQSGRRDTSTYYSPSRRGRR